MFRKPGNSHRHGKIPTEAFAKRLEICQDGFWQQCLTAGLRAEVGWIELHVGEAKVGSRAAVDWQSAHALTELSRLLSVQSRNHIVAHGAAAIILQGVAGGDGCAADIKSHAAA